MSGKRLSVVCSSPQYKLAELARSIYDASMSDLLRHGLHTEAWYQIIKATEWRIMSWDEAMGIIDKAEARWPKCSFDGLLDGEFQALSEIIKRDPTFPKRYGKHLRPARQ